MGGLFERTQQSVIKRKENIENGNINSIPSPFKRFKNDFIGLEQGCYTCITSFTKGGKTQFTLYLLFEALMYILDYPDSADMKVFYFALEENDFIINPVELVNFINNDNYKLVIICNPNNPTGFTFSKNDIKYILENTNAFVMVDETYIEFTDMSIYSSTPLVDNYKNLFVIRGTSKFFSTPGIRLGYGLTSNDKLKNKINSSLDLWNINIFASMMGEIMFTDNKFIEDTYSLMTNERDYLLNELNKFNDLKIYNSQGNFILCEIKSKYITAKDLREKLLLKRIIIRDCSSFDGLDNYFFRVCILKPEENRLLIDSLKEILNIKRV
jgi:threonine-phosphate decarboxylase